MTITAIGSSSALAYLGAAKKAKVTLDKLGLPQLSPRIEGADKGQIKKLKGQFESLASELIVATGAKKPKQIATHPLIEFLRQMINLFNGLHSGAKSLLKDLETKHPSLMTEARAKRAQNIIDALNTLKSAKANA